MAAFEYFPQLFSHYSWRADYSQNYSGIIRASLTAHICCCNSRPVSPVSLQTASCIYYMSAVVNINAVQNNTVCHGLPQCHTCCCNCRPVSLQTAFCTTCLQQWMQYRSCSLPWSDPPQVASHVYRVVPSLLSMCSSEYMCKKRQLTIQILLASRKVWENCSAVPLNCSIATDAATWGNWKNTTACASPNYLNACYVYLAPTSYTWNPMH